MNASEPVQQLSNPREVDAFFYDDDDSSSEDSTVSSSSAQVQPPATIDIALMSPPPDKRIQMSPELPPPSATAAPDSDDDDEEMPDLYIPALIAPTMFLPIPNVRPSYFSQPVLTWWPPKGVLSILCILRPILCLRY